MNREDYQLYLASRQWAIKREAVRERSNGTCEQCWINKMDAVHHLTYERVGDERLTDLIAICDPCHEFLSGKSTRDPRVILGDDLEFGEMILDSNEPLRCPFCGGQNLHQQQVEVFNRRGGEDGVSECIVVHGDNSTTQGDGNYNPSSQRDGLLIYFSCETCLAGMPPLNELSREQQEDHSKHYLLADCHLPLALAVYQHKGSTYLEWSRARPFSVPP